MRKNAKTVSKACESNTPANHSEHPTIIFCGFAKLPANASLPQTSGSLALELEVDPYDMRIVDAACTSIPALGQKFLTNLVVGRYMEEGLSAIESEIRTRYFSVTQRALIAAVEDLLRQYREYAN